MDMGKEKPHALFLTAGSTAAGPLSGCYRPVTMGDYCALWCSTSTHRHGMDGWVSGRLTRMQPRGWTYMYLMAAQLSSPLFLNFFYPSLSSVIVCLLCLYILYTSFLEIQSGIQQPYTTSRWVFLSLTPAPSMWLRATAAAEAAASPSPSPSTMAPSSLATQAARPLGFPTLLPLTRLSTAEHAL